MTNKKSAASRPATCPRSRGAIPLAQVDLDLAIFVWDLPASDLKMIADEISKDIEMIYQHSLLIRSGIM